MCAHLKIKIHQNGKNNELCGMALPSYFKRRSLTIPSSTSLAQHASSLGGVKVPRETQTIFQTTNYMRLYTFLKDTLHVVTLLVQSSVPSTSTNICYGDEYLQNVSTDTTRATARLHSGLL